MTRTSTTQTKGTSRAHLTVIEPHKALSFSDLAELWDYRELLFVLGARNIKVRYKQTVLGATWAIIRPVSMMVVFTIIFGKLAKMPSEGVPYSIFVYAGLLPWTFFSQSVSSSAQSVVGAAGMVSKVYFPRMIIPMSSISAGLVDLVIATGILFMLMGWYNVGWTLNLLAAPFLLFAVVFTALGVGMLLAALTVSYRDFTHLTGFIMQFWMYATPVIFPVSLVPENWRWLLYLNPMTGLVEGFRAAFLGREFNYLSLIISLVISIIIFILGVIYFKKSEARFADVI
jgi:lipopolysaccharide transport system permease protein